MRLLLILSTIVLLADSSAQAGDSCWALNLAQMPKGVSGSLNPKREVTIEPGSRVSDHFFDDGTMSCFLTAKDYDPAHLRHIAARTLSVSQVEPPPDNDPISIGVITFLVTGDSTIENVTCHASLKNHAAFATQTLRDFQDRIGSYFSSNLSSLVANGNCNPPTAISAEVREPEILRENNAPSASPAGE